MNKPKIHSATISRTLLYVNILMAITYLSWWFIPGHIGNPYFYGLLFFGEIYHVFMAVTFWLTVSENNRKSPTANLQSPTTNYFPSVDVFIPVTGEPKEVIENTVRAVCSLDYPNFRVYILNDGYIAGKNNWQEAEIIAERLGVTCFTRKIPHGAKAGNINDALKKTHGEIIVLFDADMVPHSDFLKRVTPYFKDNKTGFVQTPQYYQNHQLNQITAGAWDQQAVFFGPILTGKQKYNSVFICGTNVAIRRQALIHVGGMYEQSIAEDFLTSLMIHQQGWQSYYIPEVLAEGLAPQDALAYYKQQLRWARGSLQVLFGENPLFKPGLTWQQKLQYLSSSLYYFNGLIVLIDIIMPIIFLLFDLQAVVSTTTTTFALFFIPFMFLNLYSLFLVSQQTISFSVLSLNHASWFLQLRALYSVLTNEKMAFSVTPKQAQTGNFLFLTYPHLVYILVFIIAAAIGFHRNGLNPSVITNLAWGVFNIIMFVPFIKMTYQWDMLYKKLVRTQISQKQDTDYRDQYKQITQIENKDLGINN